jgi:hypothetical protein
MLDLGIRGDCSPQGGGERVINSKKLREITI